MLERRLWHKIYAGGVFQRDEIPNYYMKMMRHVMRYDRKKKRSGHCYVLKEEYKNEFGLV
jgi:hypothetical protein